MAMGAEDGSFQALEWPSLAIKFDNRSFLDLKVQHSLPLLERQVLCMATLQAPTRCCMSVSRLWLAAIPLAQRTTDMVSAGVRQA